MEKYTVVLQGTFNQKGMSSPEFAEYSQRSNANGEAHGGVVQGKYMIKENLGQNQSPHVVIIVDFPSEDAARKAFTSEEYKSIIPLREVAFKDVKILLTK